MKILVLNGANHSTDSAAQIEETCTALLEQAGHEVTIICLRDVKIASCLGCFGCWLKTPGICVINDAVHDITKTLMHSDLVVMITPITFGGYSYHLKKVLDRLIPIISPFFTTVNGEVHHRYRYAWYPASITIGLLPEEDAEQLAAFQLLIDRNALNMYSTAYYSATFYEQQPIAEIDREINSLLQKAGAITWQ